MTRKDYVKAAKIVASCWEVARTGFSESDREEHSHTANVVEDAFTEFFRDDNPNFDETKFRDACKGK